MGPGHLAGMDKAGPVALACYHCGDPCGDDHRSHDDKDFCCAGCEAVYQLLQESGLCTYYQLEDSPGVKQAATVDDPRVELFGTEAARERVVEFREDGIMRVRFRIPQMHCSSCIWLLENLHRIAPAVIRSRVSFADKEMTVTFHEDRMGLVELVALLRRIGYGPQLTGGGHARDKATEVPRMLYVRLGMAGFLFGNTMMFSFPEYLGADAEAGIKSGLQWLVVLFSLPVVFFLSTDFFRSAWAGLRARQVNIDQPIALGIVALWLRSLWDVIGGSGPGYFDSLAGLLFFLLIGRWYQARTYRALRFDRALEDFLPLAVLRRTPEGEEAVQVADLVPGDRIVVRDQELVPVDALLRAGTAHIDNSFITGEPLTVRRSVGDTIRAGGRQRGALIELEVLRTFGESRLKQLWSEHGGLRERPAMPRLMDQVARRFTFAVLLIAAGAGLYWWGKDTAQVWPVVTAVLIVACPCALALSMPFAYGHAMRLLGRRGLFLRDAEVVERLARTDTVVFDKTGTLTAREAYEVRWEGTHLTPVQRSLVRSLAHNSTHPLSAVLHHELSDPLREAHEVRERPGAGIEGTVDGVPVRIGSAAFCAGKERPRTNGEAHVHVAVRGERLGHFIITKRARAGIAQVVARLGERMRVALLTGDAQVDRDLADLFRGSLVRTGCSPADKARAITHEQQQGHTVVMVGDGLNDAGALRQSDVGITVTETSAALTPASDAILDADAIGDLPHFLRLARRARRIVVASLGISLCYNITGVSFAVSGHLTPLIAAVLMPLSSVTVVGFVTLATLLADRKGARVRPAVHQQLPAPPAHRDERPLLLERSGSAQ